MFEKLMEWDFLQENPREWPSLSRAHKTCKEKDPLHEGLFVQCYRTREEAWSFFDIRPSQRSLYVIQKNTRLTKNIIIIPILDSILLANIKHQIKTIKPALPETTRSIMISQFWFKYIITYLVCEVNQPRDLYTPLSEVITYAWQKHIKCYIIYQKLNP